MNTNSPAFNAVIAACLGRADDQQVIDVVREVLDERRNPHPAREEVNRLQKKIRDLLGTDGDRLDLIYGGATKIKGYVFEADRLPELRGASALLDFVGRDEVKRICGKERVIYAGGGSFLAVAPVGKGPTVATEIERCFTEWTQTALSVAVAHTFRLIELRFGRVRLDAAGRVDWWVDEFLKAWGDPQLRPQLEQYYYAVEEKPLAARFYQRKTFGELVTVLTTMYHRRRDERQAHGEARALPSVERLPHMVRCASSDHRPAILTTTAYGTQTALSEASARKLVVGLKVKRDAKGRADQIATAITWQAPEIVSWETKWQEYLGKAGATTRYRDHPQGEAAVPAYDTHQIGMAGNGFIGLIYADGNNVGRALAQLRTPQAYADLSKELEAAATDAVFTALAEHLQPTPVRDEDGQTVVIHPFEILTIGGDDLILIVPGTQALNIALTIGATFEQKLGLSERRPRDDRYVQATALDAYTPKIGLSAGVVIAKDDAPIFFLRQLAEELLKSAKKKARANPTAGGAVDFMVMKSITMVTDKIERFRQTALEGQQCRLTARPYLWPELAGLLATLRALREAGVPRSQLYRLRAALEPARDQGPLASTLEYLYTRTRQPQVSAEALRQHVEQNWRGVATSPPWMRREPPPDAPAKWAVWETIWADLVEIYDMAQDAEVK